MNETEQVEQPPAEAPKEEAVEQPVEPTQPEPTPEPAPVAATEPTPAPAGRTSERGPDIQVVFVTDKGFGIRTKLSEFRKAHRGTKGTRAMFLNEKNGNLVAATLVEDGDCLTILTKKGQAGLFSVDDIRLSGRGLSGVRVMTLDEDDEVIAVI